MEKSLSFFIALRVGHKGEGYLVEIEVGYFVSGSPAEIYCEEVLLYRCSKKKLFQRSDSEF